MAFLFIPFLDPDVVVPPLYVHLQEEFGTLELANKGRDEGKWVCIIYCVFIEILIILARTKSSILFLNKEGGSLWALGLSDLAGF